MKQEFEVKVIAYKHLKEIENAWIHNDYKAVLAVCDFQGLNHIDENELYDYMALLLSDYKPEESAALLLSYKLGNKLNRGQIQDIAHDMQNDPIWEEYQDISLHQELFNISALLYKIYNGKFPKPNAVKIDFELTPVNSKSKETLKAITPAFLCRLIANGADHHSILIRLFAQQILGTTFKEAKHIIWDFTEQSNKDNKTTISVLTSYYWADELERVKTFTSYAYNDEP